MPTMTLHYTVKILTVQRSFDFDQYNLNFRTNQIILFQQKKKKIVNDWADCTRVCRTVCTVCMPNYHHYSLDELLHDRMATINGGVNKWLSMY